MTTIYSTTQKGSSWQFIADNWQELYEKEQTEKNALQVQLAEYRDIVTGWQAENASLRQDNQQLCDLVNELTAELERRKVGEGELGY